MPITEYLYIDERRLNSYFEQITSPVAYDKVPVWNTGLSMIGPKAEGTQARFPRPYTSHEKLTELEQYLRENRELGEGRSKGFDARDRTDRDKAFRIEECRSRRVYVPGKSTNSQDYPGLAIWISLGWGKRYEGVGNLYLLEALPRGDRGFDVWSGYSALSIMLEEAEEEFNSSVIAEKLHRSNRNYDAFARRLAVAPFETLEALGCSTGPERNIRTLYRIRATVLDADSEQGLPTTVAYPVFIAGVE